MKYKYKFKKEVVPVEPSIVIIEDDTLQEANVIFDANHSDIRSLHVNIVE